MAVLPAARPAETSCRELRLDRRPPLEHHPTPAWPADLAGEEGQCAGTPHRRMCRPCRRQPLRRQPPPPPPAGEIRCWVAVAEREGEEVRKGREGWAPPPSPAVRLEAEARRAAEERDRWWAARIRRSDGPEGGEAVLAVLDRYRGVRRLAGGAEPEWEEAREVPQAAEDAGEDPPLDR